MAMKKLKKLGDFDLDRDNEADDEKPTHIHHCTSYAQLLKLTNYNYVGG